MATRRKASGSSSRSLRQDRDRDRDIDIDKNRDIDRQRQKFSFKHGRSDCTETSPLDRAWKTTPKWPLICYNPPIGSKVMERSSSISADLYSDLTIGLGMKNYPKMTPHMLQSAHWFQSYGKVFFHVSWFVQWPHHWIGHEKLPQNDPSYATICPLVLKLWKGPLPCQLICTVTSPLDRAWKTTPKWPLICHNQLIGSKN